MQFRKRKTREIAMQILFAWDSQAQPDDAVAAQIAASGTDEEETRSGAIAMAQATWEQLATLDAWIERLAPKWPPRRQPGVDRSLLRLAAWELTSRTAPASVAIDEAITLAKQFSTEQSAGFINGVLDTMRKEHEALIAGAAAAPATGDMAAESAPARPESPAAADSVPPQERKEAQ